MVGLTPEQRGMLIDKLPDLANLAFGGLMVGQFLSDRPFSIEIALAGFVVWILLVIWAFFLGRRRST